MVQYADKVNIVWRDHIKYGYIHSIYLLIVVKFINGKL